MKCNSGITTMLTQEKKENKKETNKCNSHLFEDKDFSKSSTKTITKQTIYEDNKQKQN